MIKWSNDQMNETAVKHKIKIDNENATEESTKKVMRVINYLFSDSFPFVHLCILYSTGFQFIFNWVF